MLKKNVSDCLKKIHDRFNPRVLETVNDSQLMLVKVEGDDIPWHFHAFDEAFWVLNGSITVFTRDETVTLNTGEFLKIPAGVEHRIESLEVTELLLIEASEFEHTGNVKSAITKSQFAKV